MSIEAPSAPRTHDTNESSNENFSDWEKLGDQQDRIDSGADPYLESDALSQEAAEKERGDTMSDADKERLFNELETFFPLPAPREKVTVTDESTPQDVIVQSRTGNEFHDVADYEDRVHAQKAEQRGGKKHSRSKQIGHNVIRFMTDPEYGNGAGARLAKEQVSRAKESLATRTESAKERVTSLRDKLTAKLAEKRQNKQARRDAKNALRMTLEAQDDLGSAVDAVNAKADSAPDTDDINQRIRERVLERRAESDVNRHNKRPVAEKARVSREATKRIGRAAKLYSVGFASSLAAPIVAANRAGVQNVRANR